MQMIRSYAKLFYKQRERGRRGEDGVRERERGGGDRHRHKESLHVPIT